MRPSIHALMERAGCYAWPARWQEIYDTVMDDFERSGCPMTDPAYIDSLADRYQILVDDRQLYKDAALAVGAREPLARLLALLCATLEDEEHRADDLKQFQPFYAPDDAPDLAVNMLTGLALCSQMPACYERLAARGLPEDVIRQTMRIPEVTVNLFRQMHRGAPGFHLLKWYQRVVVETNLYRVGRLEIELFTGFQAQACVFRNRQGELVTLAHERPLHASGVALGSAGFEDEEGSWEANILETETYWEGHPYDHRGLVSREVVRLQKEEWEKVLSRGDPVISLHIPASGRLTPEAVDDSLRNIREFLKTYFPDYEYKAFACISWLINPALVAMVGENSNIAKFCRRFTPLTRKAAGTGVFSFIFHKSGSDINLEDLPENTSLERALKAYYLSGHYLHEMSGFFL